MVSQHRCASLAWARCHAQRFPLCLFFDSASSAVEEVPSATPFHRLETEAWGQGISSRTGQCPSPGGSPAQHALDTLPHLSARLLQNQQRTPLWWDGAPQSSLPCVQHKGHARAGVTESCPELAAEKLASKATPPWCGTWPKALRQIMFFFLSLLLYVKQTFNSIKGKCVHYRQ